MADRRTQLAEAFAEVEEDEKDSTATGDTGEADESKEDEQDSSGASDKSESDVGSGEDAGKETGSKGGKEPKKADSGADVGSVGDVPAKPGKAGSVPGKSGKTPSEDAAKALEKAEKEAAEAGDAPKAWRPTEREAWTKIPKEAREAINRRETEITQFIGQHGAAIQHKKQFDDLVQPFMPFIAAQRSNPLKAFHGLMTTAARLTTGSPAQKAQVISEIMDNYGVDVKTLDEILTGKIKGGASPGAARADNNPPPWAQPIFNFMNEAQKDRQTRDQKIKDAAAAELAEFEKKPFFSDLEADIGFLMEHAANKGQRMTMQEAYDKARKMNPEVDKILNQRERAAALKESQSNGSKVDKARAAASSVKGAPGSGSPLNGAAKNNDTKKSRREILAEAIDAQKED